jgi:hypothetical protein
MFARFFLRREFSETTTKLRVRRPLHHGSLATRAPVVPLPRYRGGGKRQRPRNAIRVGVLSMARRELAKSASLILTRHLLFSSLKKEGEAERRQTLIRILRILRCGSRPFGARSSDGVPPRLSPKGIIPSQRLSFRPGFLGRGLNGRYPPSPVPVQGAPPTPVIMPGDMMPKPPGSGLQIRPRAPHPLHLTACLRGASLGERDFFLQNDAATVVKCGR